MPPELHTLPGDWACFSQLVDSSTYQLTSLGPGPAQPTCPGTEGWGGVCLKAGRTVLCLGGQTA